MEETKQSRRPRVNFSQQELELVKSLVLNHPIIEKKLHDLKTETLRKVVWQTISTEFNAETFVIKRTVPQLKSAWKRVKTAYKSQKAAERRSKFKTGGGPQSPPAEDDLKMDEMFSDQTPLANIPDGDDDYVDIEEQSRPNLEAPSRSSTAASSIADTPIAAAFTTDTPTVVAASIAKTPLAVGSGDSLLSKKKTIKKVASYAEDFHKKKMEYLKLEHELKMKVLEEERNYWVIMQENAIQNSSVPVSFPLSTSIEPRETLEQATVQLLSESLTQ